MNQYKVEPEYILAESERIHHTVNLLGNLDLLSVTVEVADLSRQVLDCMESLRRIRNCLDVLGRSLEDT